MNKALQYKGNDKLLFGIILGVLAFWLFAMGGLADRVGQLKIFRIGFIFSIVGSLLVALTPAGTIATPVLIGGGCCKDYLAPVSCLLV